MNPVVKNCHIMKKGNPRPLQRFTTMFLNPRYVKNYYIMKQMHSPNPLQRYTTIFPSFEGKPQSKNINKYCKHATQIKVMRLPKLTLLNPPKKHLQILAGNVLQLQGLRGGLRGM